MRFILVLLASTFLWSPLYAVRTIKTVWGLHRINNPLLERLMGSKPMERLKAIDQSGPVAYFGLAPKFSRFDHSVGVLALLQKAKAPFKEQVAGLLHDASHTPFSHVGDLLFYKDNQAKSYQDLVHLSYLNRMKVTDITAPHDIHLEDLNPDLPCYTALEQHLPDLCADRIQYILHTGVLLDRVTESYATELIDNLQYTDNKWYFVDKKYARTMGDLSLRFTQEFWGVPWNCVFYELFARMLKHAMTLGLITEAELKQGTDQNILNKIYASKDPKLMEDIVKLSHIHKIYTVTTYDKGEINIKPKFRGVNPYILTNGSFKRLTDMDPVFYAEFERVKAWCQNGYGINLLVTK